MLWMHYASDVESSWQLTLKVREKVVQRGVREKVVQRGVQVEAGKVSSCRLDTWGYCTAAMV
jgi:hypothetical protein